MITCLCKTCDFLPRSLLITHRHTRARARARAHTHTHTHTHTYALARRNEKGKLLMCGRGSFILRLYGPGTFDKRRSDSRDAIQLIFIHSRCPSKNNWLALLWIVVSGLSSGLSRPCLETFVVLCLPFQYETRISHVTSVCGHDIAKQEHVCRHFVKPQEICSHMNHCKIIIIQMCRTGY